MGKPKVKLPAAPALQRYDYTAFDPAQLQQLSPEQAQAIATQFDQAYYDASDADYQSRFGDLIDSNKAVREQVGRESLAPIAEVSRKAIDEKLPAAVQSELMRGGLGAALGTFDSVTPGSIGAYGVGRGLGVGALDYVNSQRDRANADYAQDLAARGQALAAREASRGRIASITEANPQRGFGLTGQDAANLQLGNLAAVNQVNVGNNAGVNQAAAANASMANQAAQQQYQAQVQAAVANARPSGLGGAIGGVLGAAAGFIPGVGSLVGGPIGGFRIGSGIGSGFG